MTSRISSSQTAQQRGLCEADIARCDISSLAALNLSFQQRSQNRERFISGHGNLRGNMILLAEKSNSILLLVEGGGLSPESKYFLQQGFLQVSEMQIQVCFIYNRIQEQNNVYLYL